METKAVDAASMDDAADDPAIWFHPRKPEQSLIFGSNKKGGLAAYNLEGEEVAYYPLGNINNVDVLNGLSLGDSTISIVGGSNRSSQSIEIFKIHPQTGALEDIKVRDFPVDTQLIDDIYGFCFAMSTQTGKAYCLINGKNGLVQQYEMLDAKGKLYDMVSDPGQRQWIKNPKVYGQLKPAVDGHRERFMKTYDSYERAVYASLS